MIPWKIFFLAVHLELSLVDILLQWRHLPMKNLKLDQRNLQDFKTEQYYFGMDWTAQSVCKYEVSM